MKKQVSAIDDVLLRYDKKSWNAEQDEPNIMSSAQLEETQRCHLERTMLLRVVIRLKDRRELLARGDQRNLN